VYYKQKQKCQESQPLGNKPVDYLLFTKHGQEIVFMYFALILNMQLFSVFSGDLFQDIGSEMEEHSPRYVSSWQRGELRHRYQTSRVHMY